MSEDSNIGLPQDVDSPIIGAGIADSQHNPVTTNGRGAEHETTATSTPSQPADSTTEYVPTDRDNCPNIQTSAPNSPYHPLHSDDCYTPRQESAQHDTTVTTPGTEPNSDDVIPNSPTLSELIGNSDSNLLEFRKSTPPSPDKKSTSPISNSAFAESNMFDFSSLRDDTSSPPLSLDVVVPDRDESECEELIVAESEGEDSQTQKNKCHDTTSQENTVDTRKIGGTHSEISVELERRSSKRSTCTMIELKKSRNDADRLPRKRKLSSSPDRGKLSRGLNEKNKYRNSPEIRISDEFYEIKRTILDSTRNSTGINAKRYNNFCNIFLKNWRYSKQFCRYTSSRTKQNLLTMLEKIVKTLHDKKLIDVKGPKDNVDVVKMVYEEVKNDNSRIFSQTPPTLTLLVTETMFEKYYTSKSGRGSMNSSEVRVVSLGPSTEQWLRLKDELGMESHSEVAAILMHCYKAWTSVACSKCRRHMEIGMEQKTGRSLLNTEASVCIVSCECDKSTSGGFMIECDSCHKWQHGVCVDVKKDDIPSYYACRRCSNIRGTIAVPEAEDSDDSVVSIDNTELYSTDDSAPEVIELD